MEARRTVTITALPTHKIMTPLTAFAALKLRRQKRLARLSLFCSLCPKAFRLSPQLNLR